MKSLIKFSVLLLSLSVSAATWYVRPTPQGIHDGTSYGNAWGALTNVVWGGGGVSSGDTLYICGMHFITMQDAPFDQGQINMVSGVTVRGDYPSDLGTVFCGAQWQLAGENNWQGPDANGVYWNPTINRGATYYHLDFQCTASNAYRLDLQTNVTWTGGLGSSAFIGNTNFVKTIDGSKPNGNLATSHYGYYFNIVGLQSITFSSLTVMSHMFQNSLSAGASNITFTACTLSDDCLPFLVTKNDGWIFGGNDISYASAGGIYAYDNSVSGMTGANNLTITNNYFHAIGFGRYAGNDGHAVGVRGYINNCTVIGNRSVGTGPSIDFFGDLQTNVTIAGNIISDTAVNVLDTGHGIALEGGGAKVNFQIYDNILCRIGTNATQAYHGAAIAGSSSYLVKVWHNTIYNAYNGVIWTPTTTILDFEDNIVSIPKHGLIKILSSSIDPSTVIDYNAYYPATGSSDAKFSINPPITHDAHSVFSNPLFAIASPTISTDFQLRAESPALGAGIPVGISTDFGGNPFLNPPAIGAWEKTGVPTRTMYIGILNLPH